MNEALAEITRIVRSLNPSGSALRSNRNIKRLPGRHVFSCAVAIGIVDAHSGS